MRSFIHKSSEKQSLKSLIEETKIDKLSKSINEAVETKEPFNSLPIVKQKKKAGIKAGYEFLGKLVLKRNILYKRGECLVTPYNMPAIMDKKNMTAELTEGYHRYVILNNGEKREVPLWIWFNLENHKDDKIPVNFKFAITCYKENRYDVVKKPAYEKWYYSEENFVKKGLSEKFVKLSDRVGMFWSKEYKYFYFADLENDNFGVLDAYIESRQNLSKLPEIRKQEAIAREERRKQEEAAERERQRLYDEQRKKEQIEREKKEKELEEIRKRTRYLNIGNGFRAGDPSDEEDLRLYNEAIKNGWKYSSRQLGRCYYAYTLEDPVTGQIYAWTEDSSD